MAYPFFYSSCFDVLQVDGLISGIHIKNIRQGVFFRPKYPEYIFGSVDQLVSFSLRISKIPENSDTGRAGSAAGRSLPAAFFQFGIKTEVTFIDGPILFLIVSRVIRTGRHTGLATDTFLRIHPDNTIGSIFVGSSGWADPYTARLVALIAQDRHKSAFLFALSV